MPLLNKTIFSCEIIVLSYKSNDTCITYYLIYDHFASKSLLKLVGEFGGMWNKFDSFLSFKIIITGILTGGNHEDIYMSLIKVFYYIYLWFRTIIGTK